MKTLSRTSIRRALCTSTWVLACALFAIAGQYVHADTTVSTDTTQNGGTFSVDPPVLLVTDADNDPTLTLTNGASASWTGAAVIGNLNGESGHLEILAGSTVNNSGSGAIGTYGSQAISNGVGYIGLNSGSTGSATVSGEDSSWTMQSNLRVGQAGTGELTISDGGSVSSSWSFLGFSSSSQGTVTVTGTDSTWNISSSFTVGRDGAGELNILDGGSVSTTNDVLLAHQTGASGLAIVSGTDSIWSVGGNLYLCGSTSSASSAQGTLDILDGGMVTVVGTTRIYGNNPSMINLGDGGTLVTQHLNPTGGNFNWTGGTLDLSGTYTGNLDIPTIGTLTGGGTITGNLTNSGILNPGNSPGITTVQGGYLHESTAVLNIEIGGLIVGDEYDRLAVDGAIQLDGGSLNIVQWNSFAPELGDSFTILTFDSLAGTFDTIDAFALGDGMAWDFSSLYTTGTISVIPEPASAMLLLVGSVLMVSRRR